MSSRYKLLVVVWIVQLVNYMDRVNISVAGPTMMKQLSINPAQFGLVLSAFSLGYACMQMPGGVLADRFGAKRLLIIAPIVWSIFTGLTGLATTLTALVAVRVCFGLVEGSSNSAYYKIVGDNFTTKERAGANAVWLSALALGPALVAPIASTLLSSVGWQNMFLWFTIPGFLVAALVYFVIPDQRNVPVVKDAPDEGRDIPWRVLLARPSSWLLFFDYLLFNIGYWGYLGWMPSYLSIDRHLDVKALGVAASIPYLAGFLGLVIFGRLGSGGLYKYRPQMVAVGYLLAAFSLYCTFSAETLAGSLVGLSFAALFLYGGFAPWASLVVDCAPLRARAAFAGLISTGGQIGGLLAPVAVGYVVHASHSFTGGFICMMIGLCASAACFFALGRNLRGQTLEAPLNVGSAH
jgi:sugar phosphate permease